MRNYRHIIKSVKYYPRKHLEKPINVSEPDTIQNNIQENNITISQPIQPKPKPAPIKIEKVVNTQQLDDFEAEYQAFIADLKAKKEREKKAKEEAEQAKMADDFEAEYQSFIEELKIMKETDETSTKETVV